MTRSHLFALVALVVAGCSDPSFCHNPEAPYRLLDRCYDGATLGGNIAIVAVVLAALIGFWAWWIGLVVGTRRDVRRILEELERRRGE